MDDKLRAAIAAELSIEPSRLKPELKLSDIESWDSVAALTVMVVVSDAVGSPVEAGEIAKLRTFGDLEALVRSKQK